jgi:hypothetical protein
MRECRSGKPGRDGGTQLGSGGKVGEREGSRVAFILNGTRAVFHRPHSRPTASKGVVDAVRRFLVPARVKP